MTDPGSTVERRHVPAFDGLRGLAVISVVVWHAWGAPFPGAGIGVDVFFVLSGFLITKLLLDEHAHYGSIWLAGFYARRALRLLPALLITLAVTVPIAWYFGDAATLEGARLNYVVNWARTDGREFGLLTHLWSLALEEQFYLVWPAILVAALGRGRRMAIAVALGGAVGATLLRALLLMAGETADRVHNGLDTRADTLLIGALIAFIPAARPARWLRWAAAVVLVGEVLTGFVPLAAGLFYTVLAVAAAIVILAALTDWSVGVLTWRPLRHVGRVSYGIYLFHFPLSSVLPKGPLSLVIVAVSSWGLATLSYEAIERRFLALKPRRERGEAPATPAGDGGEGSDPSGADEARPCR